MFGEKHTTRHDMSDMTWHVFISSTTSQGQQRWHQRRPPPLHGDQPRDGGSGDTPLGNPTTVSNVWILWVDNDLGQVTWAPRKGEKRKDPLANFREIGRLVKYFFNLARYKMSWMRTPVGLGVYICIHGQRHNDVRWVCIDLNLC